MAPQTCPVGTQTRRVLVALVALVVAAALAAAFAGRASGTTAPGAVYTVQVTITDSDIVLVPHTRTGKVKIQYISPDGRSAQFPRGVYIHFVFTNKGTKTYLPAIRFTDKRKANPYAQTPTLYKANKVTPGRHVSLYGNFYFRGSFAIEKLLDEKALGRPVRVTIY